MSDEAWHPALARQIREDLTGVDLERGPWPTFLRSVNEAYRRGDQDKEVAESTLNVVSRKLTTANEQIRRDAENRFNQLNRYYVSTLDLQEGLVLCYRRTDDGDFLHTLCRGRLCALMGYSPERVENRRLGDILRGPLKRRMLRVYAAAWAGKIRLLEGGSKRRGVRFLAVFHPRKENGVVTEVIVTAVEVTELKNTEQALRTAKVKAEAADRAKSDFLAVMSHEIRTPMNSVIGFTSLLRTTDLTSEQEHFVKMIEASGEGLLEIINDVLDISKIEAGRLELSLEPVEPILLAHEVVAIMHSRADEKGIALDLNITPELPAKVRTDRARLRQILINLLGNAVKFTAKGSVTLDVEYNADGHLICKVTDTGIGIPPEGLERLFKPFSQVDSSTTRDFGGTGLGLAICKRLSEALGGGISVTSTVGEGSCFEFSVAAPPAEEAAEAALSEAEPGAQTDLGPAKDPEDNPRIMVVDDNPTNRRVLEMILRAGGYDDLEFAENGALACSAVRQAPPDIIFMDVEMPTMDGITATKEIRALAGTTTDRPWIIGLSATVMKEAIEEARKAGMNEYLMKPVRRSAVGTAIRNRRK